MINKKFISILIIAFVVGFIFSLTINKEDNLSEICFEETCWNVEVADTPESRALGLMFRESLSENSGMWFVFPETGIYSFWMKNTLIPLDIIWINSEFEVVFIANAVPCEEDPCKGYNFEVPAKYILEVNSGTAERLDFGVGDKMIINL